MKQRQPNTSAMEKANTPVLREAERTAIAATRRNDVPAGFRSCAA